MSTISWARKCGKSLLRVASRSLLNQGRASGQGKRIDLNNVPRSIRMKTITLLITLVLSIPVALAQPEEPLPMTPLAQDGIHDPNNSAISILQRPRQSMAEFPKDRRGEVDWVKALQDGYINPRKSKDGDEYGGKEVMLEMDLDIIMTNTQNMPYVRFPHLAHTQWLACSNCHPAIFIPQEHGNAISMEKILKGKFCGRCHDKVSFSLFVCERCHSIPHEGSGPAWWN